MHIVHIIESFGAGTLQIVQALVVACDSAGWQTTVFHGHRAETPANYRSLFPASTRLKRLKTGRAINGVLDLADSLRIAAYVRQCEVDLIHGHSSKGGALARLVGVLARRPVLYTPHGFSFIGPNGPNRKKLTYLAEAALGHLPGAIVCCSPSEASVARMLSPNVSVIPNFVDAEGIRKIARSGSPAGCDVITAGRISPQKNASLFMEVAKRMPSYSFTWIGGPPDACPVPMPENVLITGWIERSEALRLMGAAKVYLSTSLYEGMPVAMMEAQALGLPVVTTDVPGSRDLVTNGVNGSLVGDAEPICEELNKLLSDQDLYELYSMNSVDRININHGISTITSQWLEYYQSISN